MLFRSLLTLLFVPALYSYLDDLANLPGRIGAWREARRARRAVVREDAATEVVGARGSSPAQVHAVAEGGDGS